MGTGAVISLSRGSYQSIRVESTSSVIWVFLELASSELDLSLLAEIEGGGVWGGEVVRFFLLRPHGGVSFGGATLFPLSVFVPFKATLPIVMNLYRSPLLWDDTINSKSLDSEIAEGAFLLPFSATCLAVDIFYGCMVPTRIH